MNGENDACECGHALETHFSDVERPGEHPPGTEPKHFRGACLAFRCDACKRYRKAGEALNVRIGWKK